MSEEVIDSSADTIPGERPVFFNGAVYFNFCRFRPWCPIGPSWLLYIKFFILIKFFEPCCICIMFVWSNANVGVK